MFTLDQVLKNPLSDEQVIVIESAQDSNGCCTVFDIFNPAKQPFPHIHTDSNELVRRGG